MSEPKVDLRVVTYMCPTHPVQLYELILELLEDAIPCYTTLQYESRKPGPLPDRPDPFVTDTIDLGKFWFYNNIPSRTQRNLVTSPLTQKRIMYQRVFF